MKFLVVGCGSIGRRHLGNLKSLQAGDLTAFDTAPGRRRAVEADLGVPTFSSLTEALASKPDAVFVTTPNSSHMPVAIEAAEAGCHLFIEKPLSHSMDDVDRLISLVRSKGLVTLVGCNMRFHPGLVKVKELVEQGILGNMVSARVQTGQWLPDWHPWEDYRQGYSANSRLGGGIILDAVHEIDYIQWLVDSRVEQVSCFAGHLSNLEIDTEDTAAILLRFANGAIGEVHMDYVQRSYGRSCHLIGDQGSIRWEFSGGRVDWYSATDGQWQEWANSPEWDSNEMYIAETRHFLRCLEGEEQPALDLGGARRVLETALAAKRSSETSQVISREAN